MQGGLLNPIMLRYACLLILTTRLSDIREWIIHTNVKMGQLILTAMLMLNTHTIAQKQMVVTELFQAHAVFRRNTLGCLVKEWPYILLVEVQTKLKA